MALKGNMVVIEDDIRFICPTATNRGVVLCYSNSGSGINLGDSAGTVDLLSPSGKTPAGLLMCDIVDIDETVRHRNFYKDEVKINERVTLMRKGRATTDAISGTPTVGATAYLTTNGQLTPTVSATGGTVATPKVGQFDSIKDANGFVTVNIDLPVV